MSLIFADPFRDPILTQYIVDKFKIDQIKLYNFGSIINAGIRLDALYPQPNVMVLLKEAKFGEGDDELTLRFDTAYMQQLLNDTDSFKTLMKFMVETQEDKDIIILCNYNERNFQPVVESLIKFIQERYGINSYVVSVFEDMDGIEKLAINHESMKQLNNFIMDCGRYANLIENPLITAQQIEKAVQDANLDAEAILENQKDELEERLSKQS